MNTGVHTGLAASKTYQDRNEIQAQIVRDERIEKSQPGLVTVKLHFYYAFGIVPS